MPCSLTVSPFLTAAESQCSLFQSNSAPSGKSTQEAQEDDSRALIAWIGLRAVQGLGKARGKLQGDLTEILAPQMLLVHKEQSHSSQMLPVHQEHQVEKTQ